RDIGRIEILQRSNLLPGRCVLLFAQSCCPFDRSSTQCPPRYEGERHDADLLHIAVVLALAFANGEACAQAWPTRPIRVIVAFSAGGIVDVMARVVCDQLSSQLRQPVVVENRGGAGTTIGTAFVAKSDPDGYTILVNSSAHTISPLLQPNLTFDPARDFS